MLKINSPEAVVVSIDPSQIDLKPICHFQKSFAMNVKSRFQ